MKRLKKNTNCTLTEFLKKFFVKIFEEESVWVQTFPLKKIDLDDQENLMYHRQIIVSTLLFQRETDTVEMVESQTTMTPEVVVEVEVVDHMDLDLVA